MFVGDHKLIYIAFPKCGSEFIRYSLNLNWVFDCDPEAWDNCPVEYCHARPQRFIKAHNIDFKDYVLFSIVRNPFARLVSCWHFFKFKIGTVLIDRFGTFENFVQEIYNNRRDLNVLPFHWMYLPLDKYCESTLDKIKFFKLEEIDKCIEWLDRNYSITIENKKVNTTDHDHYSAYYTPHMIELVKEVFKYELDRFGYVFEQASKQDNEAIQAPN